MSALRPVTLIILESFLDFLGLIDTLKYSKSASCHVLSNSSFIINLTIFVGNDEQGANDTKALEQRQQAVYSILCYNEEQGANDTKALEHSTYTMILRYYKAPYHTT
jgi:hypothetical protein